MESQCLIDTTNFIKTKIISVIFWVYFHFLIHNDIHFFCHKYISKLHNIGWEKKKSLWLNSLCYNLPYYAKSLEKYALVLPWLKFKHGHPSKTIQCDNIFGPPVVCFHPPRNIGRHKFYLRNIHCLLKTIQNFIQFSISTFKIYGFIMQTIMMDFFYTFFSLQLLFLLLSSISLFKQNLWLKYS
jgi:hypothetical protein